MYEGNLSYLCLNSFTHYLLYTLPLNLCLKMSWLPKFTRPLSYEVAWKMRLLCHLYSVGYHLRHGVNMDASCQVSHERTLWNYDGTQLDYITTQIIKLLHPFSVTFIPSHWLLQIHNAQAKLYKNVDKLELTWEIAPIRSWSKARVKNAAKVDTNATVRSRQAAPMPTPTRFCSAMKHSMYLQGKAWYEIAKTNYFSGESIVPPVNEELMRCAPCIQNMGLGYIKKVYCPFLKQELIWLPATLDNCSFSSLGFMTWF